MPEQLVNLNPFNIRKACDRNYNALVIGKRGTGKSTVISDILYFSNKKKIPRVCIFSGTEEANGFYRQFIPPTFIYNDSNVEKHLEIILQSQKDLTNKKNLGKMSKDKDIRITIVLDDVGYKKGILKSEVVRQIAMNGRHYSISIIIACQYCMHAPVDVRTNTDFVYVMKQSADLETLYKSFFNGFKNKKDFKTVLDACTSNYECFVLDNIIPTTDISEACFFYKAKLGRKFKFGCKKLWDYNNMWHLSDEEVYRRREKLKKLTGKTSGRSSSSKKNGIIVNKKKTKH